MAAVVIDNVDIAP